MEILLAYKEVFVILHLLGFALGFGGALVSDFLFFRFLKNFKLSDHEIYVLGLVSNVVWGGLLVLTLSGVGIFLGDMDTYLNSIKFLTKMFVVLIITLNGVFLHFYIKPRLKLIKWTDNIASSKRYLRRLAVAGGAVSITSWSLATVLGSLKSIPFEFGEATLLYLGLLLFVVFAAQIFESIFLYKR